MIRCRQIFARLLALRRAFGRKAKAEPVSDIREFFSADGRQVTPASYPTDETSRRILCVQTAVGVNHLFQRRELTPTDDQPVVCMNRYSYPAIVCATAAIDYCLLSQRDNLTAIAAEFASLVWVNIVQHATMTGTNVSDPGTNTPRMLSADTLCSQTTERTSRQLFIDAANAKHQTHGLLADRCGICRLVFVGLSRSGLQC